VKDLIGGTEEQAAVQSVASLWLRNKLMGSFLRTVWYEKEVAEEVRRRCNRKFVVTSATFYLLITWSLRLFSHQNYFEIFVSELFL
jgi:hypothetical protein